MHISIQGDCLRIDDILFRPYEELQEDRVSATRGTYFKIKLILEYNEAWKKFHGDYQEWLDGAPK